MPDNNQPFICSACREGKHWRCVEALVKIVSGQGGMCHCGLCEKVEWDAQQELVEVVGTG